MSEYKYKIVKSFVSELQRIFRDPGVMVIFIVATLAYPLIYKALYWNEQICDVPVAVVDFSNSPESRTFLHRWNASPDIRLTHSCTSMAEAEQLLREQKVHGIIYFPHDFARQLADPLGSSWKSAYIALLRHVLFPLYESHLPILQPGYVGVHAQYSDRPLRADGNG